MGGICFSVSKYNQFIIDFNEMFIDTTVTGD